MKTMRYSSSKNKFGFASSSLAVAALLLATTAPSSPGVGAFVGPAAASTLNKWTLPSSSFSGCSFRGGGSLSSLSASSSSTETTAAATAAASDTPDILPNFSSLEEYEAYLETKSVLPKGFATGTASGTFISQEAPALGELGIRATVIFLTNGATNNWAATFTKNKFPGAPIIVGRSRLANGGPLHALVINNKVSNVCAGGDGVGNAEIVCDAVAKTLELPGGAKTVLPSSTGVIGWRIPAQELATDVVPRAVANLQHTTALEAAKAICTTDRYPKVRSQTLKSKTGGAGARIVGIAKGAGMIEPNMATMLSYIMTDATISKSQLQAMLSAAVDESYNSISVDGAESTSDTVVLIASNQVPADAVDETEFEAALKRVCAGLAADIVRNGEGTAHTMRVKVLNFPGTDYNARQLGRHVVNSPLFKCAVSGNDPNTGRLAAAIGSFMGRFPSDKDFLGDKVTLQLGGRVIMSNGKFVLEGDAVEKEISQHMKDAQCNEHANYPEHQKFVEIVVDFGKGSGSGSATVLGSDLTAEYVAVNADYRS